MFIFYQQNVILIRERVKIELENNKLMHRLHLLFIIIIQWDKTVNTERKKLWVKIYFIWKFLWIKKGPKKFPSSFSIDNNVSSLWMSSIGNGNICVNLKKCVYEGDLFTSDETSLTASIVCWLRLRVSRRK